MAGREKDHRFIRAPTDAGYVRKETLLERLGSLDVPAEEARRIRAWIERDFAGGRREVLDLRDELDQTRPTA